MELCNVNLADYISASYSRKVLLPTKELQTAKAPVFILHPLTPRRVQKENVYTIMSHIVCGLQFLHQHQLAHRDLKPKNGKSSKSSIKMLMLVLYSLAKNKWMLADFGITSHATTDQANPTMYARGTGGYRAPELLSLPAVFTNKVDIWALGCIFYELFSFGKKAFADDFAVQAYRLSTSKPVTIINRISPISILARMAGSDNLFLSQMLAREPGERPHITLLRDVFQTRCTLTSSLVYVAAVVAKETHPLYKDWDSVLVRGLERNKLLLWLATMCEGFGKDQYSVSLLCLLVSEAPFNDSYRRRLRDLYVKIGVSLRSIEDWETLAVDNPHNRKILNDLRTLAEGYYDVRTATDLKKRLQRFDGKDERLFSLYAAILARIYGQENAWDKSAAILTDLVDKCPHDSELAEQLRVACQNTYTNEPLKVIEIWKDLVSHHPTEDALIGHLQRDLERRGDDHVAMNVWRELVIKHPRVKLLQTYLRRILHDMHDRAQAVIVWEGLVQSTQKTWR